MKQLLLLIFALAGVFGCSSPDQSAGSAPTATHEIPVSPIQPRFYYAVDTIVEQRDTLLPGRDHYRVRVVTTCLNDSAVVNSVIEEGRTVLDVSHNYQSDLFIMRDGQVLGRARLTKTLFANDSVARGLGPLQEWILSRTVYIQRQHDEFVFYTRLGIPDSDIFVEAEVALLPPASLRIVRVREQVWEE